MIEGHFYVGTLALTGFLPLNDPPPMTFKLWVAQRMKVAPKPEDVTIIDMLHFQTAQFNLEEITTAADPVFGEVRSKRATYKLATLPPKGWNWRVEDGTMWAERAPES